MTQAMREHFLAIDLLNIKDNIMSLLDICNDIELISYYRYPSCVRNVILSTQIEGEEEEVWLNIFGEKIINLLPQYSVMFDNKIVVEFKPKTKRGKKGEILTSLFFAHKDNHYYIGLTAENKDGIPPIKLKKIKK